MLGLHSPNIVSLFLYYIVILLLLSLFIPLKDILLSFPLLYYKCLMTEDVQTVEDSETNIHLNCSNKTDLTRKGSFERNQHCTNFGPYSALTRTWM